MAGSNLFSMEPSLPEPFPAQVDTWQCPRTGLVIPKTLLENLNYRERIIDQAENDPALQSDLMALCRDSVHYYINTFCWTFKQFDVVDGTKQEAVVKHVPFITWEVQDRLLNALEYAVVNAEDLGIDKSRDMGASWLTLTHLQWKWLFHDDQQILMLSRTEDYVDKKGNQKALFWKIDYLNQWLPEWMIPPYIGSGQKHRTSMHLHNELNGSTIDGESTTANAARGDRRTVVLLDEFAAVQNGAGMRTGTADVTNCRIINSTPIAGSEYSKWITSGKLKVFKLAWWEHPEKGVGRHLVQDAITKKWTIRSPWYDAEEERRSPVEMAQEVDMDHLGSGALFFEPTAIAQHHALCARPPKQRLDIDLDEEIANPKVQGVLKALDLSAITLSREREGALRVWAELPDKRLDQNLTYVIGIDLSKGQGASNSVASIVCEQTREKVAELTTAVVPPYEFARMIVALALWVGGNNAKNLPMLIWEMNGPGWDFGRLVVKDFKYPMYYVDRTTGQVTEKQSKKYGWHNSGGEKKEALLSMYRRNLAHGGIINHSAEALEECLTYIYFDRAAGKMAIGPSGLQEESETARKTHGDRVIADALAIWLLDDYTHTIKPTGPNVPPNSAAGRRQALRRKRLRAKRDNRIAWNKKFDFTE